MEKLKFFISFAIYFTIVSTQQGVPSCVNSFWFYQYERAETWGLVTVPKPNRPINSRNFLRINLSLGAKLPSQYVGEISVLSNSPAQSSPLLFRVRFPLKKPLVKPTAIYLNENLLCAGPKETGKYVSSLTMDFFFLNGVSTANSTKRFFVQTPKATRAPATTTRKAPFIVNPNKNFQCGVTDYLESTGLVIRGNKAARGQFPWLAAYYHNSRYETGFICGGSIISNKLVLTAAHCIQSKKDSRKRKAEEAIFFLGKYNIETLNGDGYFVSSGVSQFIVHPQWDFKSDSYDADLALAVMVRNIEFSRYIRPICVWSSTRSYHDLIGKYGTIAGWGKTQHVESAVSDIPKWAYVPVVDYSTCIRSRSEFRELTSPRTFCAGRRTQDIGPCNGDSGGGFIVQYGKTWYLRGIISSSLFNKETQSCDTLNYAVFTDVAQFSEWIQRYIQAYG